MSAPAYEQFERDMAGTSEADRAGDRPTLAEVTADERPTAEAVCVWCHIGAPFHSGVCQPCFNAEHNDDPWGEYR